MTNIFKAIISRDSGCPWGETGMTSAKWLDVPTRSFYIANLIATQPGVLLAPLIKPALLPIGGDAMPHVIEWRGEHYLEDGHHRVVRAALAGNRYIAARHFRVPDAARTFGLADLRKVADAILEQERAPVVRMMHPADAPAPVVKIAHLMRVSQQAIDDQRDWLELIA